LSYVESSSGVRSSFKLSLSTCFKSKSLKKFLSKNTLGNGPRQTSPVGHKKAPNIDGGHNMPKKRFVDTLFEIKMEEEQDALLTRSKKMSGDDDSGPCSKPASAGGSISEWEAAASLAKAFMGAGSFALPWVFSQMGYIAGPIFMTVLSFLSVYSMKLLVRCSRLTGPAGLGSSSYVEVARICFGKTGARLCYTASISASIGVCGSYLVFIAANLQALLSSSSQQGSLVVAILPIAVLLSGVRDMKHFAFASLLGDISVVLGMGVVLVYGLMYHASTMGDGCLAVGKVETIPLALGTIGYLFLVHFLVLPIESSMARPENFESVINITFGVCAVLSGAFGVIGYLLFGADTQQIVLLNVEGSYFVLSVKLLLCVDLLLTYPVVMRPSILIVEQSVAVWFGAKKVVKNPATTTSPAGWSTHMAVCAGLGLVATWSKWPFSHRFGA
jgi:proton-coupled amino acid transporter